MNRTDYSHYYLVGIKGVAMTSLAQLLVDAGNTVSGCDTAEEFVTQPQLDTLGLEIEVGFDHLLPVGIDCVVYTAAHQGSENPIVLQALGQNIPVFSHAEALAAFFNEKNGIAVCGVGGKSTTSAMITWILEKSGAQPSYAVGVGEILGLPKTGRWNEKGKYFVAEADEYASNPTEMKQGAPLIPRFKYLEPSLTVCTNIAFDHPDVYKNFEHTLAVFSTFFKQLKPNGILCCSEETKKMVNLERTDVRCITCGSEATTDYSYVITIPDPARPPQVTITEKSSGTTQVLDLMVPGPHNVMDAAYAIAACAQLGIDLSTSCQALHSFASTKRRFERIGEKNGVVYYDDYAHHPSEIAMVLTTLKQWFPGKRSIIAFQSHTFSRTKQLFSEFVRVLSQADEVVMIDIFPSAREAFDPTVSSDTLCTAIQAAAPQIQVQNVHTLENLATYLQSATHAGDICVTVGAGDIYKVHTLIHSL